LAQERERIKEERKTHITRTSKYDRGAGGGKIKHGIFDELGEKGTMKNKKTANLATLMAR
jgi:hypothetical protein